MAGFVYVMTNKAFPNLVKIGRSSKDPRIDRVNELNQTGVPHPFRVEYFAFVESEAHVERQVHQYFEHSRPNKSREFFEVEVVEAINAIRNAAKLYNGLKYEEMYYVSPEEVNARERKRLEEQAKLNLKIENDRRREEQIKLAEENRRAKEREERLRVEDMERRQLARERLDEQKQRSKDLIIGYVAFFVSLPIGLLAIVMPVLFLPFFWLLGVSFVKFSK